MEKYKFQAKSEEGLLEKALDELKLKESDVLTKYYEEKGGLFSGKKYTIEVVKLSDIADLGKDLLKELLNSLNMNKRDTSKLFFNGVYLKESFSKCRADDNIRYIFDEGIIQYIYAIYLRKKTEPEEKIIIELAQLYGLPDYLYVIRATSKTIYSRLINRGRKTRILETDNLLEDIEKLQTIEQQIVSIILEKGLMDSEKISIYDNN